MRTVCGSEFQRVGAEDRKARLEKSVLMNGLSSTFVCTPFTSDCGSQTAKSKERNTVTVGLPDTAVRILTEAYSVHATANSVG